MNLLDTIAAAYVRIPFSPLYQSYKNRVESSGGMLALSMKDMKYHYPVVSRAIWAFVASGYKKGKLFTLFPNTPSSDINFTRNSTKTYFNKLGKLVECSIDDPTFEWDPTDGLYGGINLSMQYTNRVPNSVSSSYGNSNNVTISPYTWNFTDLYTHAGYFAGNGVERTLSKLVSVTNVGNVIVSFYIEMEDGSEPNFGQNNDPNADFSIHIGGGNILIRNDAVIYKKKVSSTVWYISGFVNYSGVSTNQYIRKHPLQSNKSFRATGCMIETFSTTPGRHIVTKGTVASKLYDYAWANITLPMNNIVMYADMNCNNTISSNNLPQGFSIKIDLNNFLSVGFTPNRFIGMALVQNGITVLQINSTVKEGKVCAKFKNGEYTLIINGLEYNSFIIGDQEIISNFSYSTLLNIGNSEVDVNLKCVAILKNMTISEMKHITQ